MANLLTTASQVMCTHGGQATLSTSNTKVNAGGTAVLVESDIHTVAGCSFMIGNKPSPCMRIEWSAGVSKVSVGSVKPLTESSTGKCISAEGATQGTATVVNTQAKASAT